MDLESLNEQIGDLAELPPHEAIQIWGELKNRIDLVCTQLTSGAISGPHDHLPLIARMITQLDQVIAAMELPRNKI